jgi:transposase
MGVSEGAVSQWMKRGRAGGPEALRHRPRAGAPRRLTAEPLARVPALLQRGSDAYGFRGQTTSEHYLPPWGMKPTVLEHHNLVDLHTLTLTH